MNWEKKLYHHEVQPPEGIWDSVQESLDEPVSLREKLLSASTPPPAFVWKKILSTLTGEEITVPARRAVLRPIFRVAAAAAVVGVMLWGVYTLFVRPSAERLPILNETAAATIDQPIAPVSKHKPVMISAPQVLGAAQLAMAGLRTRRLKSATNAGVIAAAYYQPQDENEKHWNYQSQDQEPAVGNIDLTKASYLINLTGLVRQGNEEYFTVQGPNGEPIQVSSKFKNVIHLLNLDTVDEEMGDKLFSESKDWREKFKAWKEKMSQSSYTPDGGNFLDIAELIKLLKEEKNYFYSQYPLF